MKPPFGAKPPPYQRNGDTFTFSGNVISVHTIRDVIIIANDPKGIKFMLIDFAYFMLAVLAAALIPVIGWAYLIGYMVWYLARMTGHKYTVVLVTDTKRFPIHSFYDVFSNDDEQTNQAMSEAQQLRASILALVAQPTH